MDYGTMINLDDLEKLCNAATPGPWASDNYKSLPTVWYSEPHSGVAIACEVGNNRDATFISVCRTAVPEMIAEIRALRAKVLELSQGPHDD